MLRISVLIILTLFMFTSAQADDSAFGGEGASPMPIEQTAVKMISEDVLIQGYHINEGEKGAWRITGDYIFNNSTNKLLVFKMGFPFPIDDELTGISVPVGRIVKKGDALVYDFAINIDGEAVAVTRQKIASNHEKGLSYEDAYIWNVQFSPQQTITVHHNFITGVTVNVMGQTIVSYVLKTGGLWQGGTIGRAKLVIMPNTPTRLCSELDKNGGDYMKPKPPGVKIVGTGRDKKYIWDLKNFLPKDDLQLCLQTGRDYVRFNVVYPLLRMTDKRVDLNVMTAAELRIFRNMVYAQYGKKFADQKLQDFFNKQWWYESNTDYSDSMLTKEDKEAIALISKAESKR